MKKPSLKQQLNELVRRRGQVTFRELEELNKSLFFGRFYKLSNIERRLRTSESPDIEAIEEHGHIVAYKHKHPIIFVERKVLNSDGSVYRTIRVPLEG